MHNNSTKHVILVCLAIMICNYSNSNVAFSFVKSEIIILGKYEKKILQNLCWEGCEPYRAVLSPPV